MIKTKKEKETENISVKNVMQVPAHLGEEVDPGEIKAEFKHGILKTVRSGRKKQNRQWKKTNTSPLKDNISNQGNY